MDLVEPVEQTKKQINSAFHKRLVRLGIRKDKIKPRDENDIDYKKAISAINALQKEGLSYADAREKYLDEVTFTLFNRLAGIKVMETHQLIPEVIKIRAKHGDRSFAHNVWLDENPSYRSSTLEGLDKFIKDKFKELSEDINLYSPDYPYDLLPEVHDLKEIIRSFNTKIPDEEWEKDDILGWMYEAYNKQDYKDFKESGEKIEYDKLALSSQMYTPRWVVEFLVNNSLGKYWLEINPTSSIKDRHDIANAPEEPLLKYKNVEKIKVIDPAVGSGNFLLYAFDLLYEIYQEEGYNPDKIPALILKNNLYGIDIDERAVQIAKLQLYIKAKRKNRNTNVEEINIVSTDFHLPPFEEVKDQFNINLDFAINEAEFIEKLWENLREAYKFGSLIRLRDALESFLESKRKQKQLSLGESIDINNAKEIIITKLRNIISSLQDGIKIIFLKHQSIDALKFAEIMINKYDIAVTNPPYTDSGNYGEELKAFVNNNYKKPVYFYQNLYASFLKVNSDLINNNGKIAMIHPLTFMYIKTYKDMREFILNNYHINLFVEFGLGGIFKGIAVDPAIYVLEKNSYENNVLFIKLNQYQHNRKNELVQQALFDYINGIKNEHVYTLEQEKLWIIDSYPFIYWISDSFREKFEEEQLGDILDVKQGLATSNNLRFLRFWWEVDENDISENYEKDQKKWVPYQKGGEYKKWYGNNWLLVNWENNGYEIKNLYDENGRLRSRPQNEDYYFKEGITYTLATAKGISMRYLPPNNIFDVGGSCIFLGKQYNKVYYVLGLMNSKLASYTVNCLNPSVNSQVGDFVRVPFFYPDGIIEKKVINLSKQNVNIKRELYKYSLVEREFEYSPIDYNWQESVTNPEKRLKRYIDYKSSKETNILINEAVIDELVFDVYELSEEDRKMVLEKEGLPVGAYPVFERDRDNYLKTQENLLEEAVEYINNLNLEKRSRDNLKNEVKKLYLKNKSVEEISKELELNPISVVEIIKELSIYPQKLAYQISHEFILDIVRDILNNNDDGIVIINEYAGEEPLDEQVKNKLLEKGFTSGDINRIESMLGKGIKEYLLSRFFKDECDTLNLFMYLPKTPFVWHLTSGEYHGFDAFTIIYKWSRDSVFKIKSYYIDKRRSGLTNMLNSLAADDSADAEKKKDLIRKQLNEIKEFEDKLDELLASGYDPELDDGVGKNIAPLQNLGLLAEDVLTKSQLKKFLNADW